MHCSKARDQALARPQATTSVQGAKADGPERLLKHKISVRPNVNQKHNSLCSRARQSATSKGYRKALQHSTSRSTLAGCQRGATRYTLTEKTQRSRLPCSRSRGPSTHRHPRGTALPESSNTLRTVLCVRSIRQHIIQHSKHTKRR